MRSSLAWASLFSLAFTLACGDDTSGGGGAGGGDPEGGSGGVSEGGNGTGGTGDGGAPTSVRSPFVINSGTSPSGLFSTPGTYLTSFNATSALNTASMTNTAGKDQLIVRGFVQFASNNDESPSHNGFPEIGSGFGQYLPQNLQEERIFQIVPEAGLPGYEVGVWFGVAAPGGTPRPIVDKLNAEIVKILHMPDVKEKFVAQGVEPVGSTVEQFQAHLQKQRSTWAKVVKDAGVTPE